MKNTHDVDYPFKIESLMNAFALIITFILFFCIPEHAHAWSPATHLRIGEIILSNKFLLPSAISSLISSFAYDFLYGMIGADVILGKNLAPYHDHCHNWKFGFLMLENSTCNAQKAFSYGYLAHLASDVVAHNFFIPIMMVKMAHLSINTHFGWEYIAEKASSSNLIKYAKFVMKNADRRDDELMEKSLKRTLFSFKTNKVLFSGIIFAQRVNNIINNIKKSQKKSGNLLHRETVKHYERISVCSAFDIIMRGKESELLEYNPTGQDAIAVSRILRKAKRSLIKRFGFSSKDGFLELLQSYLPDEEKLEHIAENIFDEIGIKY